VGGRDELAHLAQVFNHAAGELARLFEEAHQERANAEAARAALQEHAKELARVNADLQQFAYSASHDLQEPLRTVSLYSQLLHKRYSDKLDERADLYIDYLFRAARQMEQMITDLLAYTQTDSVTKDVETQTDVRAILDRVLTTLEVQLRDLDYTVTADPLPMVAAHEIHVQQLLQNLIGNAIKYRSDRPLEIRVWAEQKDDYYVFAVQDNGIGIEEQYARQIFGIFKRLHGQKYAGTGIGLAICQRIVEGYGGKIWVESEVGQGSTFWFTLPAASLLTSR
jgi:light-regulated signal transduction histidine kinase (bacteriophytochrome)